MDFEKYETITTKRLVLKVLDESWVFLVLSFLEEGRNVFERYEAAKAPVYYTEAFQRHMIKSEYDAFKKGMYLRYYIFEKKIPDIIIGTVSFGNVLPDPFTCCNLGYKISPSRFGMGYGTEAVYAAVNAAYSYLNTHRINAFVQENNIPSIRVLEKCGFFLEGKCIKNIHIKGKWTDHLLYAAINPHYN